VTPAELTGQARSHIVELPAPLGWLNSTVAVPLLRLREAAANAGMDLVPVSGFRDFSRQLDIWNGKYAGERPMRDARGVLLDAQSLSPPERIDAILLWSALPGASRHHWGTDVDLIDAGAVPAGYQVGLTEEEFAPGGPFAQLSGWLDTHAARFGFFRPYRGVRSGVRAEPWHFSFAPTAEGARRQLTPAVLHDVLAAAPLLGKEWILPRIEALHARYVATVEVP
jgi:LAS superfamily LD-carboxypeptidase LdcB